jgi:hypothetical protein
MSQMRNPLFSIIFHATSSLDGSAGSLLPA